MCGIAGLFRSDGRPVETAVLDALAAALGHRGPDGSGRHLDGPVGMVQTRLAIIDLETGDQPIRAAGLALIANGEIYNYRELAAELTALGVSLATRSDCEPPLHLYRRDGPAFVERLRGMYAIALHDQAAGRLVLARDPFGIKPLYYAETPVGLAFASEPQALVAAGLMSAALDTGKAGELVQLQFTTGDRMPLAGIRRVLPGEVLVVEGGRIVERRRRHPLPAEVDPLPLHEDDAIRRLDTELADAVDLHQRSDVPYGMFLSGGVDSSALLAMMARLNDRPVLAFTAGFPGAAVPDERAHAARVARAVGAEHVDVPVAEADFWDNLPAIAACLDDPVADYAVVPTWLLARAARRHVKVVLAGEGGDELFAGYGRYRAALRPWPLRRPARRRGTLDGLSVLRPGVADGWRDGLTTAESLAPDGLTRLQREQAADIGEWLPNDLLLKLDRCLMAHGVEGRVPFVDPALGRFAFRLPDGLKVRGRLGKWLLRRWLAEALPAADAMARKRGFTVPVGEWIAGRGRELGPLVARRPEIAVLCDPAAAAGLFTASHPRARFAAWTLLLYALWHRRHIEGRAADGDVLHCLTES